MSEMSDRLVADGLWFSRIKEIWCRLPAERRTPDGLWSAIGGYNQKWIVYFAGGVAQPTPTPQTVFGWVNPKPPPPKILIPNLSFILPPISNPLVDMMRGIDAKTRSVLTISNPADGILDGIVVKINQIVTANTTMFLGAMRWDNAWHEKQTKQYEEYLLACRDLEIDTCYEQQDKYYKDMPYERLLQEAASVRWLKQMAQQGLVQTPEAVAYLKRLTESGKLTSHTLARFMRLFIAPPLLSRENDKREHYTTNPPPIEAGWDAIFDRYYSVPRWVCLDMKKLSELLFCTHGTVKNRHGDYTLQYGEQPMPKKHILFS